MDIRLELTWLIFPLEKLIPPPHTPADFALSYPIEHYDRIQFILSALLTGHIFCAIWDAGDTT